MTALKPGWTKDKRGPPPKNADPTTLKTEKDFPHIVEARKLAAEKRAATKARKLLVPKTTRPWHRGKRELLKRSVRKKS